MLDRSERVTSHDLLPMPLTRRSLTHVTSRVRAIQVYLTGPSEHGAYLLDTHDRPVPDQVWPLYALVQQNTDGVATLLEWDADIPAFPDLVTELAKAKDVRAGRMPPAEPSRPAMGTATPPPQLAGGVRNHG